MTVIAYRDGIMACDSLWSVGHLKVLWHTKIIRLASGALFGDSGDADNRELIALLTGCKSGKDIPSVETLASLRAQAVAILVFPSGVGWYIVSPGEDKSGGCGIWPAWKGRKGFNAVGSGDALAIGAMEAGASALDAVKIACRRNIMCELPAHILELK